MMKTSLTFVDEDLEVLLLLHESLGVVLLPCLSGAQLVGPQHTEVLLTHLVAQQQVDGRLPVHVLHSVDVVPDQSKQSQVLM